MSRRKYIFTRREKIIDLSLETEICLGIAQKKPEQAAECSRCRVRPSYYSQDPIRCHFSESWGGSVTLKARLVNLRTVNKDEKQEGEELPNSETGL
jgi:hypothetical protein